MEANFLGVAIESILDDGEVLSSETRVMALKGHNFLSDRWIALKCLQDFLRAVFLEGSMESVLSDEEVSSG